MPSLYVHIPFCVRKCEYCDFYSEAAGERDIDRYLVALECEFTLRYPDGIAPETVFLGGGTPTRLSAEQLRTLGEIFKRRVDLSRCIEFTCEINPGTLTPEKADALVALGVDRASFGVQSFNPDFLKSLGRIYEVGTPPQAVAMARAAGITRVSMDLMFALPGQNLTQLRDDLHQALSFGTEHLSLYALTYEDDTPLTRDLQSGKVQPCPEELERAMFSTVGDFCAKSGLQRYEVSNFARPGAECRHNLVYWRVGEWAGLGAGAHSMLDHEIIENAADHKAYADALEAGKLPFVRREKLTVGRQVETLLLMALRLDEGVEVARLDALIGEKFTARAADALETLTRQGLIECGAHLRCTDRGLMVLDSVILEIACVLDRTTALPA
ncbi:MAG: radical SAM family heme chaperone HemW [Planctomycetes bacterium]|nr:radical SAM family heme chaperone HemW [Planctomycetota bacterium]